MRVTQTSSVTRFRMQPETPPVETTGTATITSILGGRFVSEENTGSMMNHPQSGLRIYGYNNGTETYEGVWVYSLSTAIMTLVGSSDDDGKTIEFTAKFDETTGRLQNLYVVLREIDANQFVVELRTRPRKEICGSVLETTYIRAE